VVGRGFLALGAEHSPPVGESIWGNTALRLNGIAPGAYRDALTGTEVRVSDNALDLGPIFSTLPLALLERRP